MILKVLSQSLLVARIRGESSFSSPSSSSLDCLCLSLSFRISFCFMCLWLRMGCLLRQSWCECASVCLCLCASVWGCATVGWEQKSPHPAHLLSLCLCTAQLLKQKYKNTKRNKKTSSLFASVQFCYNKYKNTTTFNQSENLFSFYHYSECTESVTMTLVLKLRWLQQKWALHKSILILLHLCCAHLSPLFDQRRKYCRVWPGST